MDITSIKKYVPAETLSVVLIIVSFAISIFFYRHFPAIVATHWNIKGVADHYSGRAFGAFFIPCLLAGLYILLSFLPYVDPRRERYAEFGDVYSGIKMLIILFLFVVYIIAGLKGMGYNIAIGTIIPFMVGCLFLALGWYLPQVKNNWFVGIRNPWTLSSEEVWNKTHRMGGPVFMIAGLCIILGTFVPEALRVAILIIACVLIIIVPTVYSYILYARLNNKNK